jgi:Sulfotransferase domain
LHLRNHLLLLAEAIAKAAPGSAGLALRRNLRDQRLLRSADVAVVSFPKSGRTFLRVLLSHLYHLKYGLDKRLLLEFDNLHRLDASIPRVLFTHDGDAMRTPEDIAVSGFLYSGKSVIFLARHPADIAVSRFYHLQNRSRDAARIKLSQQPLEDFIWTRFGGIPSITAFLNAWHKVATGHKSFSLCRYEDLLEKPAESLQCLSSFLGIGASLQQIHEAIEFSSFENMRDNEKSDFFGTDRLRARDQGNAFSGKVRSGKALGFRKLFSGDVTAKIDRYVNDQLNPALGY